MKPTGFRWAPALLAFFTTGLVLAQDGGRPPEGATPEEKRAFYQKRAAERAKTAESGAPMLPLTAGGGSQPEARGSNGRPPEGATQEEKRAFYQKRAAERARAEAGEEKSPIAPVRSTLAAAAHDHRHVGGQESAPPVNAPAKADETGRRSERPGSMGGRGAGNVIWLSDSPPSRGDGASRGGMGGMGGMGMGGGTRNGPPTKRLWLRAGADPVKSGFAREDAEAPAEMLLVKPKGPAEGEALPQPEEGKKNLSFEMPVQGYYRLYVTTRKVLGETLNVSVAKIEVANFSHGGDEEEHAQSLVAPRVLESALIEIVREKAPAEKTMFQLKSGDEQAFVVLQKGLPLQGARVRFVSHEGWTKEALSDEQGRVSFQIIRDYFPPWDNFKKRFKGTYLVIAEASLPEKGNYKDQAYSSVRYQTTLSGSYYPSPDDYRSYAWGLGIGLLIVILCGVAVYFHRRRRVKPVQEVRFHETE